MFGKFCNFKVKSPFGMANKVWDENTFQTSVAILMKFGKGQVKVTTSHTL